MSDKSMMDSILSDLESKGSEWDETDVRSLIERAFEAGKADQSDPLAGYSNLTAAIKAGEPIDWAKLDGKKVQCDNPDVGTNRGELGRNETYTSERSAGWFYKSMDKTYVRSLIDAWRGDDGWTLWVEGEIPLARKTADQLEVGTYFLGKARGDDPYLAYVGRQLGIDTVKTIYYAPDMLKAITPASEWVVLEEYGPFQKPEDK